MRNPSLLAVRDAGERWWTSAASPDGRLLAASRPGVGEGLQLLDAATLEPLEFEEDIPASGIAFSPDSTLLAMAVNQWNGDSPPRIDPQPVRLYEMPDGTLADRQLGGFPEGSAVEYSLDFSADGTRVVAEVQHFDPATRLWACGIRGDGLGPGRSEPAGVPDEGAGLPDPRAQPRRPAPLRRADGRGPRPPGPGVRRRLRPADLRRPGPTSSTRSERSPPT